MPQSKFRILDLNINDGVPFARVVVECQVSRRTLQHWKKNFMSGGLNELELKERQDKGSSGCCQKIWKISRKHIRCKNRHYYQSYRSLS
ncbi:helix-turn-helix domain-containing protein [Dyadobacter chenwenxiniae]|uniref:helix-turn-helix domain-containing protein n=1 Tax=Dyadobacter chenwenxiniae TaxID=2906456 RepID=UPI0035B6325C